MSVAKAALVQLRKAGNVSVKCRGELAIGRGRASIKKPRVVRRVEIQNAVRYSKNASFRQRARPLGYFGIGTGYSGLKEAFFGRAPFQIQALRIRVAIDEYQPITAAG